MVVDLNKREILDSDNYDIWCQEIQYHLDEQSVLKKIEQIMQELEVGNTTQHQRDFEAYENWYKKDHYAQFTMLSNMHNDLSNEFE